MTIKKRAAFTDDHSDRDIMILGTHFNGLRGFIWSLNLVSEGSTSSLSTGLVSAHRAELAHEARLLNREFLDRTHLLAEREEFG